MTILASLADLFLLASSAEHIYILVLESFLWTKPQGLKAFRMTPEKAQVTASLAANQGVYNGFLAVAGFMSLFFSYGPAAFHSSQLSHVFRLYFLGCVIFASVVGAATASPRILLVQGGPAILALGLYLLS
eukprot:TRINITY_DN3749_c0_g1_i1.p1 TRINITY_DN3749_c0_g1~~TRINITY_DN3749_c0_g1_i1.p1  ORF type:complete len:131 (-),score=35.59 TRINITY_DN3749_c0_g1_i1:1121-1513(-)